MAMLYFWANAFRPVRKAIFLMEVPTKKRKHLSAILLTLALALGALTGCAGTPVSTGDAGTTGAPETTAAPETTEAPAAKVKTGLSISADISGSKSATAEKTGSAQLDACITAMTMNGDVISSCYIDSVQAKVAFDAAGAVTISIGDFQALIAKAAAQ